MAYGPVTTIVGASNTVDTTALKNRITALNTDVSTLESKISTLEGKVFHYSCYYKGLWYDENGSYYDKNGNRHDIDGTVTATGGIYTPEGYYCDNTGYYYNSSGTRKAYQFPYSIIEFEENIDYDGNVKGYYMTTVEFRLGNKIVRLKRGSGLSYYNGSQWVGGSWSGAISNNYLGEKSEYDMLFWMTINSAKTNTGESLPILIGGRYNNLGYFTKG